MLLLGPQEQISVKFYSKYKTFHSRKCISSKYRLQNGGHFISASMCYNLQDMLYADKITCNNRPHPRADGNQGPVLQKAFLLKCKIYKKLRVLIW